MKNLKKRQLIPVILLALVALFFLAAAGISGALFMVGFVGFVASLLYILLYKLFKKKISKKLMVSPLLFLIVFFVGAVTFSAPDDESDISRSNLTETVMETENLTTEETTETAKILMSDFKTVDEYLVAATEGVEKNSTEMVDKLGFLAMEDAETVSDQQLEEAIDFLSDTYPNYFDTPELMEKTMYYGYLLDYAYEDDNDDHSKLGNDAYQAVKYVYRGVEKVEDESTQANLEQIANDFSALSITTPYQESVDAEEKAKQESIEAEKKAAEEKAKQESIAAEKKAAEEKAKQESIAAKQKAAEEKARQESIQAEEENSSMVWISATGSKYHSVPDCGNMNPNKAYQMSQSEAEASGYDACKKCH